MGYYSETLTKILHIPGVGSKTAQKIVSEIKGQSLRDDEDLITFISFKKNDLRLSKLSEIDIRDAFQKGEKVIEESVKAGVKTISIFDTDYPAKLKQFKNNPPVLLHYKGDFSCVKDYLSCAVIGTREPSDNGYSIGVRVGELLAENKVVVVSGLAKGCDTAGHTGCLNKNGKTAAVLAHGLKHLYPKENKKLAETIIEKGGALISEYFYDQTARNNFFVERDRIQAGLSDNVFVVETGIKGGTMHTVKYALENQRKIFTYCHPVKYQMEEKAQGNQMLIMESKATPVANAIDFEKFLVFMFNHQPEWQSMPNGPSPDIQFIQPHGSYLLGTFMKPLDESGFDIDVTLKLPEPDFLIRKSDDSAFKKESPVVQKTDSNPQKKKKVKKVNQILKRIESGQKESEENKKSDNDSQMNIWVE